MVFGYDVRGMPRTWNELDRQLFLVEPATPSILSADTAVWPRVPTGNASRFWGLLLSLSDAIAVRNASGHELSVVALSCNKNAEPFTGFPKATPHEIQPNWAWLGYDITDTSLTSFLSNMSAGAHRNALQNVGVRPNRFGLLEDDATEQAVIEVAAKLVPSHAPFIFVGLWLACAGNIT